MAKLFLRDSKVIVDNLDVTALDFEFKALASLKPEPNKCVLTLYNLNADHRAQLLKRNRPNPTGKLVGIYVEVQAGYKNALSTIFAGDLREVASNRDNLNWKTVLSGDDGGRAYREARFPNGGLSFRKGATLANIIKQCCDAMGIGSGNVATFAAAAKMGNASTLSGPMVFDGPVAAGLTRLLSSVGLTWSIQRGALQIRQPGQPSLDLTSIVISSSTGLLGSPEASIDSSVSLGNPQQWAAGAPLKQKKIKPHDPSIIKFKTMLIPGLVPGRGVVLKTDAFNGSYYVTEVEAVGQSWSSSWELNCVARVPGGKGL